MKSFNKIRRNLGEIPLLSSNLEKTTLNPKSIYKMDANELGELIFSITKQRRKKRLSLKALGAYLAKGSE